MDKPVLSYVRHASVDEDGTIILHPAPLIAPLVMLAATLIVTGLGAYLAGVLAEYYLNTQTTRDREVGPGLVAGVLSLGCVGWFVWAIVRIVRCYRYGRQPTMLTAVGGHLRIDCPLKWGMTSRRYPMSRFEAYYLSGAGLRLFGPKVWKLHLLSRWPTSIRFVPRSDDDLDQLRQRLAVVFGRAELGGNSRRFP